MFGCQEYFNTREEMQAYLSEIYEGEGEYIYKQNDAYKVINGHFQVIPDKKGDKIIGYYVRIY